VTSEGRISGEIFTLVTGTFPLAVTVNETVRRFVLSIIAAASGERMIFGSAGSKRTRGVPSLISSATLPSEDFPVFAVTEEETPPDDEEYAFAETAPARADFVAELADWFEEERAEDEAALAAVEALFAEEAALPEKAFWLVVGFDFATAFDVDEEFVVPSMSSNCDQSNSFFGAFFFCCSAISSSMLF